jgi:drug/metabolite transporter (DMT)-like permease
METLTFSPVGGGAVAFALVAGWIYIPRMRQEQGLPRRPLLEAPWVVGLFLISLAPWTLSHVVDGHRPDDVFQAWVIGFPSGCFLGSFGGVLWVRSALKTHFPERYGQR